MQKTLFPEKLYNIKFEDDVSNKNNKVNIALNYKLDFIDYANYAYFGIRILYPYNWEKAEDNGVKFFSPVYRIF
jgi:hypothetical protein